MPITRSSRANSENFTQLSDELLRELRDRRNRRRRTRSEGTTEEVEGSLLLRPIFASISTGVSTPGEAMEAQGVERSEEANEGRNIGNEAETTDDQRNGRETVSNISLLEVERNSELQNSSKHREEEGRGTGNSSSGNIKAEDLVKVFMSQLNLRRDEQEEIIIKPPKLLPLKSLKRAELGEFIVRFERTKSRMRNSSKKVDLMDFISYEVIY